MAKSAAGECVEGHRLKDKVTMRGDGRDIDLAAIERARSALDELSVNFDDWAVDEVGRLVAARDAVMQNGYTGDSAEDLFCIAHDLKGEAGTFGYPLVTRICVSLCNLLELVGASADVPLDLIDHHVDAVRAIVRDQIKGERNATAITLVNQLAAITNSYLEARERSRTASVGNAA